MTRLEAIRAASALAHVAPGARLTLACTGGQLVEIGAHPSADLHPCAWTRVVRSASTPGQPDILRHVEGLELGGSLTDVGAGIYRRGSDHDGRAERWFTTFLAPDRTRELFAACPVPGADSATGTLRPDAGLGVTVVTVHPKPLADGPDLDELALWAVGACLVEEVIAAGAEVTR